MVAYPSFIQSLQKFDTLLPKKMLQDKPLSNLTREIDHQFRTYLVELTRKISAHANLDNSTLDQNFLSTRAVIFPEVINLLPKLKRLEKAFEDKKLASETTLTDLAAQAENSIEDYPAEIRKWIEEGQIQITGPAKPEAIEELIGVYHKQIIKIRSYKEEIFETILRYFPKEILLQPSLNIIADNFTEDHPLRQRIEDRIKYVATSQSNKTPKSVTSEQFVKSNHEQKANGARGGKVKAERRYQEFSRWVADTNFPVENHRTTSIANFASILKMKGFLIDAKPISANTAASYRERYLSNLDQSLK